MFCGGSPESLSSGNHRGQSGHCGPFGPESKFSNDYVLKSVLARRQRIRTVRAKISWNNKPTSQKFDVANAAHAYGGRIPHTARYRNALHMATLRLRSRSYRMTSTVTFGMTIMFCKVFQMKGKAAHPHEIASKVFLQALSHKLRSSA